MERDKKILQNFVIGYAAASLNELMKTKKEPSFGSLSEDVKETAKEMEKENKKIEPKKVADLSGVHKIYIHEPAYSISYLSIANKNFILPYTSYRRYSPPRYSLPKKSLVDLLYELHEKEYTKKALNAKSTRELLSMLSRFDPKVKILQEGLKKSVSKQVRRKNVASVEEAIRVVEIPFYKNMLQKIYDIHKQTAEIKEIDDKLLKVEEFGKNAYRAKEAIEALAAVKNRFDMVIQQLMEEDEEIFFQTEFYEVKESVRYTYSKESLQRYIQEGRFGDIVNVSEAKMTDVVKFEYLSLKDIFEYTQKYEFMLKERYFYKLSKLYAEEEEEPPLDFSDKPEEMMLDDDLLFDEDPDVNFYSGMKM